MRRLPDWIRQEKVNVADHMDYFRKNPTDWISPVPIQELKTETKKYRATLKKVRIFRGRGAAKKAYKLATRLNENFSHCTAKLGFREYGVYEIEWYSPTYQSMKKRKKRMRILVRKAK